MKEKVRYASAKRGGEEFSFTVGQIRYRDSKNRIVKFTTKKKLKVEVIAKTRVRNKRGNMVWQQRELKSYKLPLRYRKKPITIEQTEKRINKRTFKQRKALRQTIEDGKVKFTYF